MSTHLIPVRSTTSRAERENRPGEKSTISGCEKNMPYTYYFEDMFLFKEKELAEKEREKIMNRGRKVHEKTTFSSRMKNRSHLGEINIPAESASCDLGLDSALILSFVERTADGKKSIQDFIRDQRERFLLEYTLATKRKTMMKLQRCMEMKEQQFLNAEKRLQEDAFAFEEFLRENDQKSVDAVKMAAQETIGKLQMTSELKKANLEIQFVKSEIMKTEFLLKEYMKYGCFLLKLSPKTWQVQQALKKMKSKDTSAVPSLPKLVSRAPLPPKGRTSKENIEMTKKTGNMEDSSRLRGFHQDSGGIEAGIPSRRKKNLEGGHHKAWERDLYFHQRIKINNDWKKPKKGSFEKKKPPSPKAASISSEDSFDFSIDEIDYDLEPELYFKEPEELLQVLTELEEQNLTLVQYSQDVDETLDDVSKREKAIQDKVNSSIEALMDQKEMLKTSCAREEEKAAELELRSRLFNFGEFNSEIQERLIESLSRKVNQVYKVCIGEVDVTNLNPVQKLVKVESRLVELSDLIDSVPKENIEAIEKAKQRERRQKMREEKMKERQKSQEEKIRIALERAVSEPKRKMGRKLVYRSQPLTDIKQEILFVDDTKSKLLEEQYFFT
ncbi:coiled-coil domain-containing protein 38 [Dromiciops gliroides]|uniref:coiled-coil domain-containing protein 38 n=1 Tax=Dromiciops gliroides TaxID=33562 RepID=UPI001CC7F8CF|nr:coiled-coil domain-containing protein 38 [Dromiciops gliroides]